MLGASPVLPLFQAIRSAFNVILSWLTSVINAIVSTSGPLYSLFPLFVISISIAAVLIAIAIIRRIINA